FNERTGTPFNFLEYPTEIVLLSLSISARDKDSISMLSIHDEYHPHITMTDDGIRKRSQQASSSVHLRHDSLMTDQTSLHFKPDVLFLTTCVVLAEVAHAPEAEWVAALPGRA